MNYRGNLGCLWILLLLALVGGTPLLIGVLRVFLFFVAVVTIGGGVASWWIRRQAVRHYTTSQSERHNRFVELLVALLVKLGQIDGELERVEITAIRQFFQSPLGYDGERLLWVRDLIKEARHSTESVASLCAQIAESYTLQERLIVLQVLASVAQADGRVTPAEERFVEEIAERLGLAAFVRSFESGWGRRGGAAGPAPPSSRERIDDALATLGLAHGATGAEIKQAWRNLSKENHPDRVNHLGEEFRRLAEERMRKINAAYDILKEAGLAG